MATHSFITFPPDLRALGRSEWLLLGEVAARIQHISTTPLAPDMCQSLRQQSLVKGIHSTTAIEGNAYSEDEVARILAGELHAPPSRQYQQRQVENMARAFAVIETDIANDSLLPFAVAQLHHWHELVMDGLGGEGDEAIAVGAFRQHNVTVGRYLAPNPQDAANFMREHCQWLKCAEQRFAGSLLAAGVLQAIVAHVYFAWIHPYGDGNGRMARLIEFTILRDAGASDVCAHLPSYFYHSTRDEYYRRLQESHGEFRDSGYPAESNLASFIRYALQGYKDELNAQLDIIRACQVDIVWRAHVRGDFYRRFGGALSKKRQRQMRLILELTERSMDKPAQSGEIRGMSTALYAAYYGMSDRTIMRDLDELTAMNLLEKDARGYRPNIGILLPFQ